nr:amidohydrolase family protein [Sphingomonas tagetis]
MIETGRSWGPRVFSTGEPLYWDETAFSKPPQTLEEVRQGVRRLKAIGAAAIKLYTLPRREQRQWVLQAAREEGLLAIPEGAQKIAFDLTLLTDGYSTLEHAIKTAPLRADVLGLFKATGIPLVPTLTVGPGGGAEDFFYARGGVAQDEKLLRFTPLNEVAARDRLRAARSEGSWYFQHLARSSADVLRAGGKLALGAHGNLEGLGVHWEMWAMADGGLTPMETLYAATMGSADAMGLSRDVGSIESGKRADLAILDANPLDDIRNSNSVGLVMKGGLLWNAATMDQIWPQARPFPGFYWRKQP